MRQLCHQRSDLLCGVRARDEDALLRLDAFVKEAPQFDDLTMVGLKYNGPQENTQTEE